MLSTCVLINGPDAVSLPSYVLGAYVNVLMFEYAWIQDAKITIAEKVSISLLITEHNDRHSVDIFKCSFCHKNPVGNILALFQTTAQHRKGDKQVPEPMSMFDAPALFQGKLADIQLDEGMGELSYTFYVLTIHGYSFMP